MKKIDPRTPLAKGETIPYETKSDIGLTITMKCANSLCKRKTRLRLVKGGSAMGYYHNKRYGMFDTRNEAFVCPDCQKDYDEYFKKDKYFNNFGLLSYNRCLA